MGQCYTIVTLVSSDDENLISEMRFKRGENVYRQKLPNLYMYYFLERTVNRIYC